MASVSAPLFRWEWNLNTIAVLVGFAAGFVAWGYTLSELKTGRDYNASNIRELEQRMTVVEASTRILDNHELRITGVERQASDAAAAMRTIEASINALASDIRVTREIVQRIEESQIANRGARSPPR